MAKFRIVTPTGASFTVAGGGYDHEMEALDGMDAEIVECPATEEGFIAGVATADAIYAKGMSFNKAMIDALPATCRGIVLGTVGVDYVDVAAATARGIPVTNCPDTFMRRWPTTPWRCCSRASAASSSRTGWCAKDGGATAGRNFWKSRVLMGSVMGFISFGRVARMTALRAKAFGLRLLAYDPFIDETLIRQFGAEPATLEEVLRLSDFVSMHAPATPEAKGMLTTKHFKLMKKTAWFINTGRGHTVDEPALIEALEQKWIAGASLDVFAQEPPRPDNPLLAMPQVILSPHNASASSRFDPARKRRVGRELSLLLGGKWPMSCVNPTVLASSSLRRWQPYSMERGPNS